MGPGRFQDTAYKFGTSVRKALFGGGTTAPSLASATKGADPEKPLTTAVTRTYYIQAEEREWVCFLSSHLSLEHAH